MTMPDEQLHMTCGECKWFKLEEGEHARGWGCCTVPIPQWVNGDQHNDSGHSGHCDASCCCCKTFKKKAEKKPAKKLTSHALWPKLGYR